MHHGPFPIRFGRLVGGLAGVALGACLSSMLVPDRLTCDPPPEECRLSRPLHAAVTFRRERLREVRVTRRRGSKGHLFGVPTLYLDNGGRDLRQVEPAQADAFAASVNGAIARGSPIDADLHEPWALGIVTLAMLAMGIGLVVTAVRGIGRYRLDHDAVGRKLRVHRTVFGVPVSRTVVSTSDVVDVEVEWRRDKDFYHRRYEVGDTVGRLLLATSDGDRRRVTESFHRGYTLHRRAADELRVLLGCPPRSPELAARLDRDAAGFYPPPGVVGTAGRLALAWLGMCCGCLVGMAVYGLGGLALGVFHMKDNMDPSVAMIGGGGGALAGIALMLYVGRPRPPR